VKRKSLVLLSLIVAGGLSCDRAANPLTTGSINVHLAVPPGPRVVTPGSASAAIANASATTSVTLDSVRVTLSGGPTARSQVFKNAVGGFFEVSMSGLDVGSYTVAVEGLSAGAVAYYGQTPNVGVTAGQTSQATINFPPFQPSSTTVVVPDTVDVLQFGVSFDQVPSATGYIVQWSKSPTMANASSKAITGTSAVIDVADEATYWVTVKATNALIPNGGRSTDARAVYAFQGVATVAVTPDAQTIAFGGTLQLSADSKDANNNAVPAVAYVWVSSNPNVAIVSQTGLVTAIGSGATTITAVGKGTPGSVTITVGPAPTTKLVFTAPPSNTAAGAAITGLQVAVQNASGQIVTTDNSTQVTIAIGANPSSGTLSGTATATVANGVATFSGLSINKTGIGYTLTATATNLAAANSGVFNVNPGAASKLVFSVQPLGTTTAGDAISPAVQVEIQDALGNRVTTARDEITLAIATNPSIAAAGVLTGTKKVNAIDGVASFTGLWINKTGTGYTMGASAATVANGATSTGFNISPAAPAKLTFGQQPSNVQGNIALAPAVTVVITDQYDNATAATNSVTLSIGNNPWKSIFSPGGSMSGTNLTVAAVAGTATFANVRVDKPSPGYTLAATSGSLSSAASSAFNVTLSVQPDTQSLSRIKLTAGASHTCAIMTSGSTYCWGANGNGQLGAVTGNTNSDSIAALVRDGDKPAGINFVTVSAGSSHTCGITSDSLAYCWGYNGNGQLGNGSVAASPTPVLVSGNLRFKSISAGGNHTCAVTGNGSTVATKSQVYCWGYNGQAQLGDSASATTSNIPVRVRWPDALKNNAAVDTGVKVLQVTAGGNHTCAIVATFAAYCWGYNYYGQLGDGAVLISGGQGANRVAPGTTAGPFAWGSISAGGSYTCGVLRANGNIYCWGENYYGTLGDNTGGVFSEADNKSSPVLVNSLSWSSVSAGSLHTCGILGGAAYCWGYNGNGLLGIGSTTAQTFNTPQAVSGGLSFTNVDVGGNHTCGRTAAGVYCWGYGGNGQLGSPGSPKTVPTLIVQ